MQAFKNREEINTKALATAVTQIIEDRTVTEALIPPRCSSVMIHESLCNEWARLKSVKKE